MTLAVLLLHHGFAPWMAMVSIACFIAGVVGCGLVMSGMNTDPGHRQTSKE